MLNSHQIFLLSMSDSIKHECGIALLRLKKPLQFYVEKYGTAFYGINKLHLLMEKQHNRGQDGAGVANIKFDMEPGDRYISRTRSIKKSPIQDIFDQINSRSTLVTLVYFSIKLLSVLILASSVLPPLL